MKYCILLISLLLFACSDDIVNATPSGNSSIIVDAVQYSSAPDDELSITAVSVANDSLFITFSASGCDGSSWDIKLIDSQKIAESLPVQRYIRLSLSNPETCEAIISKEVAFSISEIQVGTSVIIHLKDWEEDILYEF